MCMVFEFSSHVPVINLFFFKAHIFAVKFILVFPQMIVSYPLCCMSTPFAHHSCVHMDVRMCVHAFRLYVAQSHISHRGGVVRICSQLSQADCELNVFLGTFSLSFFFFFFSAVPLSTQLELRSGHTNRQTDRQTRTHTHTHIHAVSQRKTHSFQNKSL